MTELSKELQELKDLRDKTRKQLAEKIVAICKYAENNDFSKILSIYNMRYSSV